MKLFLPALNLILMVILVVLSFKFIEEKKIAGFLGANIFFFGSLLNLYLYRAQNFWKTLGVHLHLIFLVCFVGPMLIWRLWNWDVAFSGLSFGPISGPEFHKLSSQYYRFMMLMVILEQVRLFWGQKKRLKAAS